MITCVKTVDYLEEYELYLTFNTGESDEVDLEDMVLKYSTATSLQNIEKIHIVRLDKWSTEVWGLRTSD